jgi:hypothetical protein
VIGSEVIHFAGGRERVGYAASQHAPSGLSGPAAQEARRVGREWDPPLLAAAQALRPGGAAVRPRSRPGTRSRRASDWRSGGGGAQVLCLKAPGKRGATASRVADASDAVMAAAARAALPHVRVFHLHTLAAPPVRRVPAESGAPATLRRADQTPEQIEVATPPPYRPRSGAQGA